MTNIVMELEMAIEKVSFQLKMVIFDSYLNVYQRVNISKHAVHLLEQSRKASHGILDLPDRTQVDRRKVTRGP